MNIAEDLNYFCTYVCRVIWTLLSEEQDTVVNEPELIHSIWEKVKQNLLNIFTSNTFQKGRNMFKDRWAFGTCLGCISILISDFFYYECHLGPGGEWVLWVFNLSWPQQSDPQCFLEPLKARVLRGGKLAATQEKLPQHLPLSPQFKTLNQSCSWGPAVYTGFIVQSS